MATSHNARAKLNQAVNRIIANDPPSAEKLQQLAGQSIEWKVRHWGINVFAQIKQKELLFHFSQSTADCCIIASPTEMLQCLKNKDISVLEITGDEQVAQSFFDLLFSLNIVWEDWLADYLPPLAVNAIAYKTNTIKNYIEGKKAHLKNDWQHFVREETNQNNH